MIIRNGLFAAVLAGLGCVPAYAAPIEEINCPLELLSESEFEDLVDWVTEVAAPEDPRFTVLIEAAGSCLQRYDWSESDFSWAVQFTAALANSAVLSGELRTLGIDPEQIEFIILADEEFLQVIRSMVVTEQAIMDVITRNLAAIENVMGERSKDDALLGMILQFAAARAAQQVSREQFVEG